MYKKININQFILPDLNIEKKAIFNKKKLHKSTLPYYLYVL